MHLFLSEQSQWSSQLFEKHWYTTRCVVIKYFVTDILAYIGAQIYVCVSL